MTDEPPTVTIWFDGHPKGGNWRKRADRWAVVAEDNLWKDTAAKLAVNAVRSVPGTPFGTCEMYVTWHWPIRNDHDWDNAVGMLKGIGDGLKGRVFRDDSSRCILRLHLAEKVPSRRGIEIVVVGLQSSLIP